MQSFEVFREMVKDDRKGVRTSLLQTNDFSHRRAPRPVRTVRDLLCYVFEASEALGSIVRVPSFQGKWCETEGRKREWRDEESGVVALPIKRKWNPISSLFRFSGSSYSRRALFFGQSKHGPTPPHSIVLLNCHDFVSAFFHRLQDFGIKCPSLNYRHFPILNVCFYELF